MAEQNKNAVAVKQQSANVGDQVIARINQLCETGFTMPKDYNWVNAIKMSMLKLQDVKDRAGKPALQVCKPNSVTSSLFKMATQGLNLALNQCYFIVYGDELVMQPSYFGKVLQVKRIFPDWEPYARTIREGDVFEFEIDPKNGHKHLIKHEQTLETMDKPFIGAYVILPTKEGDGDLYVMTKKQIVSAWAKSSSKEHATANQFDEKMATKTVINSGCNMIINSTPSYYAGEFDKDDPNAPEEQSQPETIMIEDVNIDTGEVQNLDEIPTPAPAPAPHPEPVVEAAAPATKPTPAAADDDF